MKPIRLLVLLAIALAADFGIQANERRADVMQEAHLRSMIVENPDSVLSLLDVAEKMHPAPLPQYKIDLLRGLAYNEKNMTTLVELYATRALADDSTEANPKVKLNLLTMLSDAKVVTGDYQGSINAARLSKALR